MCIAIAAEVLSVVEDGKRARVLWAGNELEVDARMVAAVPGDFVMIHAGCAIEVVSRDCARELDGLYGLMEPGEG